MKLIIIFFRILLYLLKRQPAQRRAFKLEREGKIRERDELVNKLVCPWARFMVKLTGKDTQVIVEGAEKIPAEPVVFVCNHQGNFDIPILLGYIDKPKAFISKIEILKIPMLSGWMKLMQCTFLDRKNPRQSIQAMSEAVENAKKGYSLVIFPEGTRSRGGPVAEFKAGSFKLAFRSGLPVVPVTIDGSWHLFEEHNKPSSGTVRVTVHAPVSVAGLSKEQQALIPPQIQAVIESAMTPRK
ncbi:MAG: 1-acyl-sn-glycerol-3-phosphate acyltransferase [Bacteroides sp.]|nr:1-acyl-sn-glycerol-3-phosphate acyltransferase [Prevotella sp.]MCM1407204.1 1-acyl-sn-glycerol-3-phosphate acyltransferase [Treponema brennaborense]MCM1470356.1 1-acyl-sn-glycerol-3-phosphate acyltransferase [Bacteroides sp.]